MMMTSNKINLCKKYEGHNRTYWYMYSALMFNTEIASLGRKLGKVNLYIGDKQCPFNLKKNEIIYAIEYREYSGHTDEERELLHYSLSNHSKFKYFYKIDDDVHCYVFSLNEDFAKIYEEFKQSRYSKMNLPVTIQNTKAKYGELLQEVGKNKDSFLYRVYHSIKKTEEGKQNFNKWLKENNIKANVEELELESKLIESEEILRYE